MPRERTEIGELIARIYDRLDSQFGGRAEIVDALLLVEVNDHEDTVVLEDGIEDREVPTTIVLLESTTDRVTVQEGIVEFARRTLVGEAGFDDD